MSTTTQQLTGILLDQAELSLTELAQACTIHPQWVIEHVSAGLLLNNPPADLNLLHFNSVALIRARRLLAIERDFDANPELAALVVDLIEQLEYLKCRLHIAGVN